MYGYERSKSCTYLTYVHEPSSRYLLPKFGQVCVGHGRPGNEKVLLRIVLANNAFVFFVLDNYDIRTS